MGVKDIYSGVGGLLPDDYDREYRRIRGHGINCAICGMELGPQAWVCHYIHSGPGGNYHVCGGCAEYGDAPQERLDKIVEDLYWELHARFAHFLDDDQRKAYIRRLEREAQP